MDSLSMAPGREVGEHREHSRSGKGDEENLKVEPKLVMNRPRRRHHHVEDVDKPDPILEDMIILRNQVIVTLHRENATLKEQLEKIERRLDHLEEKQQHKAAQETQDVAKLQGHSAQPLDSSLISDFRMLPISTTMNTNNAVKSTMPIKTMAEGPSKDLTGDGPKRKADSDVLHGFFGRESRCPRVL
ncbi:MAG: hypothetical protein Q9228_006592 [Teloschistes exilis]